MNGESLGNLAILGAGILMGGGLAILWGNAARPGPRGRDGSECRSGASPSCRCSMQIHPGLEERDGMGLDLGQGR